MANKSHKAKQFLLLLLKIVVVVAAITFIGYKLTSNENLDFNEFLGTLLEYRVFTIRNVLILLLLSFLNWLLEIKKWQSLSQLVRENSIKRATKESLASFTAAILTPSRIGEYGAKSLFYRKPNRRKIIFLNFLGNIAQLIATFFFGGIGLFYLLTQLDFGVTAVNSFLMVAVLFVPLLVYWTMKRYQWEIKGYSIDKFEKSLRNIPKSVRWKTLIFAGFRYLLFTHQFYFLLLLFNVELPYLLVISAVFTTYFLASIIPTMMIFDAVIKGGFAVWIFGLLYVPEIAILVIVLTVWILNFGFPALAGSYFVLRYKKPQPKRVAP